MTDETASIFVLDTSVLIHDPDCLSGFRNTHVAIPIFCIMELDDLKDGKKYDVATAAREASRRISALSEYGSLNDPNGVLDPETGSRYYAVSSQEGSGIEALKSTGSTRHMDLLILESALVVQKNHADKNTVLITKDINLRILSDAEGLTAEDYERDKVYISDLYRGARVIHDFDEERVKELYYTDDQMTVADLGLDLMPNEFVVFDTGRVRHLFRNVSGVLKIVPKDFNVGIDPRNLEQRMALDLLMDPEIQLVTMVGKAGTGKTFLALASAIAQMGPDGLYDSILLSKPTLAMGHSDVGFLPGTLEEKMEPWMASFFDNFDQIIPTRNKRRNGHEGERNWEYLLHTNAVKLQTIHTIRGRSIPNSLMFIDEAQNLTPHEIKTIITRAAKGTKVILSGDPFQCDSRFLDQHSNGLTYVTERMKDQSRFGTVFIESGVRSELSELAATLL